MRTLLAATLLVLGCSGARAPLVTPAPPPAPQQPRPQPPKGGPAIESATYDVRTYAHPTTDPASSLPTAGGIVRIRAPLETAYAAAIDFGSLTELNPWIETSVVVGKEGDLTDVYIHVPTVIDQYVWAVVRFRPVPVEGGWACRGVMVDGNLDDLRIFWRLVPTGPNETLGQLEVLADPALPLPRSWVLRDTKEGVHIMLERFRWKVEARAG